MKAAQATNYGGKEVIQINTEAPKPDIAADQILVEVHAAGVNPFDIKAREGEVRHYTELKFPATLGGDLAGLVAAIGEDVTGFEVGQAVFGQAGPLSGHGSYAEFAPVKAGHAAPKPASVDFITAAALPTVSVSAYQALVEHIDLQTGQKILIHGGAGGIGSLAIQLAKHLGAYVATTAGAAEADYVKSLGADEIIDYKTQDFSQQLEAYDAVFDTVGGETTTKSYTILKPGGTLVSMVERPDEKLVEQHKINFVAQFTQVNTAHLKKIAELVNDGVLQPQIDKVFPLEQAAEAMEYLQVGHPRGKVVLQVKT